MYVRDYLELACASDIGALSIANIGGEGPDAEQNKNRGVLINYLNQANVEIHKRFALLQKEHVFCDMVPACYYDIPLDFIRPIAAYLSNGKEIGINNEKFSLQTDDIDQRYSLLFPEPFKALIKMDGLPPRPTQRDLTVGSVGMIYQAVPPKVCKMDDFLDLSEAFTDAVLNYMAYRAYSKLETSQQSTDNTFYIRFLSCVKSIKMDGLVPVDNLDSNMKLHDRGFV